MSQIDVVLIAAAVVCFVLAAAGATKPNVNWVPLGYACLALTLLV